VFWRTAKGGERLRLLEFPVTRMPKASLFCDVDTALDEIRSGRMIVVVDDEDRENEGDLTMAAEKITPEASTSWPSTDAASSVSP